jgi:hypothetical protein
VFRSVWTWLIPLACAGAVLAFVLATTPPGFGSVATLVFSTGGDPAAYAAGAAASLALLTLICMAGVCAGVELVVRRVMGL